jgi:hypothetical protein
MKKSILTCIIIIYSLNLGKSQNFELIEGHTPVPYINDGTLHLGEIYFTAPIDDHELYKVTEDLNIVKVPELVENHYAKNLTFVGNSVYFVGFSTDWQRGILRYDVVADSVEFLQQIYGGFIDQKFSMKEGAIYVDEEGNNTNNKTIYYFEEGKEPSIIISDINLGDSDFHITEIANYIIISPVNDEFYDDGVILYNKDTQQLDNTFFVNICSEARYAYGFESILIYSCEDTYFAYDLASQESVALNIQGDNGIDNYLENEKFIFLYNQLEDLVAIRKNTLQIEELSNSVTSVVDLSDESGFIYFTEGNSTIGDILFKCNGSLESKQEIKYLDGALRVKSGAVLMGRTHLVASQSENSGFINGFIGVIEEDELVPIRSISQGSPVNLFETLGSAIVFTTSNFSFGTDFYSLKYPLANEVPIDHKEKFYPTVTYDGVLKPFSNENFKFDLLDASGRLIKKYDRSEEVILPRSGMYYISRKIGKKRIVQRVIRI